MESPSLEIFQTRLDAVLCSLLWVTLLGQGVGLGDPQRALADPTMPGFCDSVRRERSSTLTPKPRRNAAACGQHGVRPERVRYGLHSHGANTTRSNAEHQLPTPPPPDLLVFPSTDE